MKVSRPNLARMLRRLAPYVPLFLPILVIGWATYVNRFPNGFIFSGGDFSQPLNLQENFRRFFYVWNNRISAPAEGGFFSWFSATGFYFLNYYLPNRLGLNDTQVLSFVFFIFFSSAYVSFLAATYIFFPGREKVSRALVSLGYSLNFTTLYFFTYSWGFSHIVLLYVFIPVLAAVFLVSLIQKKLNYALIFIVILFFSAPAYTNSAFAVALALFLILSVVLFSLLGLIRWDLGQLRLLFLMILGGFLVLSYWILPTLVFVSEGLRSLSNGLFDLKGWLNAQSANVLSIFTGTPHYGSYYPFHYNNDPISLLAFAPIIFLGLLLLKKNKDGNKESSRLIIALGALFIIFSVLVKKTMPPFAGLSLLLYRLPFLLTLRSYEKTAVFLPFIIFLAIFIFLRSASGWKRRLAFGVLVLFIFSVRPFFMGGIQTNYGISIPLSKDYKNADYSLIVKIPSDYEKLSQLSNLNKTDSRIQSMPYGVLNSVLWVNYPKWHLIGSDPTEALFNKNVLFANSSTYALRNWNMPQFFLESIYSPEWYVKMLPYFGVSEVVYHKDVDPYFYRITSPSMDKMEKGGYLNKLTETEMGTLYSLKNENILPHFYLPKNILWLDGRVSGLANVVEFPDHELRSAVYLDADVSPRDRESIRNSVDGFYVQGESVKSLLRRVPNSVAVPEEEYVTPNTRFLPGSPFYFIPSWLEDRQLGRQKDSPARADTLLWFATKRLTETAKLIQKGKLEAAKRNLIRYLETLKGSVLLLQEVSQQRADSYSLIIKANLYLAQHEKILEGIRNDIPDPQVLDLYQESLGLYRRVSGLLLENGMAYYLVKLSQPGPYETYLRFQDGVPEEILKSSEKLGLTVDRSNQKEVLHDLTAVDTNLIKLGGDLIFNVGYHSLSFPTFRGQNLVPDGSFENTQTHLQGELSSDSIDGRYSLKIMFPSYSGQSLEIPLKDYKPGINYRVSFYYKTLSGDGINFSLWQDENDLTNLRSRQGKGEVVYPLDESLGKKELWRYFESELRSGVSAHQAKLIFRQTKPEQIDINLIDNLRFEPIYEPDLILRQIAHQPSLEKPGVNFQKINPTLYKLSVKGAQGTFRLVFSESFHSGWKLYIKKPFTQQIGAPVKSYFDGQISEGPHSESDFTWDFARNFFSKSLPEDRHNLVNGYANAWEIKPEDFDGQSDFTIYVEFTPQRLFYLGLVISLAVVTATVSFLFILWRQRQRVTKL